MLIPVIQPAVEAVVGRSGDRAEWCIVVELRVEHLVAKSRSTQPYNRGIAWKTWVQKTGMSSVGRPPGVEIDLVCERQNEKEMQR